MGDEQQSTGKTQAPAGTAAPATNDTAALFLAHMEYASKIVRSWPAWKQRVLGGPAFEPPKPQPGQSQIQR